MRWDRFFEDLEDQLDSEWEAERAALDTEAERLRLARLTLRERLVGLAGGADAAPSLDLLDGSVVTGGVAAVGADWVAVDVAEGGMGAVIVPLTAIVAIGMPHADLLRSARGATGSRLQERMTFGFVLRDIVRRRVPVTVQVHAGRTLTGTVDRAAADHLDLALHDRGVARRREAVVGHRIIPLTAIACVRLDAPVALL